MYQVTVLWNGAEIGYGEGESKAFAMEEAVESVESAYRPAQAEWTYEVIES